MIRKGQCSIKATNNTPLVWNHCYKGIYFCVLYVTVQEVMASHPKVHLGGRTEVVRVLHSLRGHLVILRGMLVVSVICSDC